MQSSYTKYVLFLDLCLTVDVVPISIQIQRMKLVVVRSVVFIRYY